MRVLASLYLEYHEIYIKLPNMKSILGGKTFLAVRSVGALTETSTKCVLKNTLPEEMRLADE
jgi:hypothetical protein